MEWLAVGGAYVFSVVVLLGRGLVGALGGHFFDRQLERVRADLKRDVDSELAQVKAGLDVQTQIRTTQFLHLSERRLDIAVSIFTDLQAAVAGIHQAANPLQTISTDPAGSADEIQAAGREHRSKNLREARCLINTFIVRFNNHRFLFPEPTVKLFDEATAEFKSAFFDAGYAMEETDRDDRSEAQTLRRKAWETVTERLPPLTAAIESDLRSLAGVEPGT